MNRHKNIKKLVLYGAGGFGREIAYMVEIINYARPFTYELLGFIVDEEYYKEGETVNGYPVLGTRDWLLEHKEDVVCTCTIGENPEVRQKIQEDLEKEGIIFEPLINPYVPMHWSINVGDGAIICGGVGMTVNITVGKGVVLNGNCLIGHDVTIGDYSCIMSGANITGYSQIGKRVRMGGYAYITPNKKVGDDAVVAAGSIVFTNVKAGTHVLGNPAKRIEL